MKQIYLVLGIRPMVDAWPLRGWNGSDPSQWNHRVIGVYRWAMLAGLADFNPFNMK